MTQLLTNSRVASFKKCRRRHWYEYEQCIRPVDAAKALRMGTTGHLALETLNSDGFEAAIDAIRHEYIWMPPFVEKLEWEYERETMERLICGYLWRWKDTGIRYVAKERAFQLPLLNPETGVRSRNFDLAGKIDGIISLEDGRLAVMEHKFLGEDIGTDAPLWSRLRMDSQITLYVGAARRLGYNVESILYDVIRKPTIKPEAVPILDGDGLKIVLDSQGRRVLTKQGRPRQTADKELGYTLQTRPMSPKEWGEELIRDIQERPDYYFARREIPRLESDLDEFQHEQWHLGQVIRNAQLKKQWFRTVTRDTCPFCPYFSLCSEKRDLTELPPGFEKVGNLHPELEVTNHVAERTPATAAPAPQAGPTPAQGDQWFFSEPAAPGV